MRRRSYAEFLIAKAEEEQLAKKRNELKRLVEELIGSFFATILVFIACFLLIPIIANMM